MKRTTPTCPLRLATLSLAFLLALPAVADGKPGRDVYTGPFAPVARESSCGTFPEIGACEICATGPSDSLAQANLGRIVTEWSRNYRVNYSIGAISIETGGKQPLLACAVITSGDYIPLVANPPAALDPSISGRFPLKGARHPETLREAGPRGAPRPEANTGSLSDVDGWQSSVAGAYAP